MGNKNYTKYSEKSNNIIKNIEETNMNVDGDVMTTNPMANVEPELPDVNKGYNNNIEPETEIIEEGDVKLIGVVAGCARLNVRKEPNKEARVLCVINKDEEVVIENTYEDFYEVITAKGVKGYCMKQFININ